MFLMVMMKKNLMKGVAGIKFNDNDDGMAKET